jgi:hypothetical protein
LSKAGWKKLHLGLSRSTIFYNGLDALTLTFTQVNYQPFFSNVHACQPEFVEGGFKQNKPIIQQRYPWINPVSTGLNLTAFCNDGEQ